VAPVGGGSLRRQATESRFMPPPSSPGALRTCTASGSSRNH
jgi:hypothetical protein